MAKKVRRVVNKYDRPIEEIIAGQEDYSKVKSLTKKDESKTIRQILNQSINGIEYLPQSSPFYEEEAQMTGYAFNEIYRMEFSDKAEVYKEISQKTKELSKKAQEHHDLLQKKKEEEAAIARKRIEWQDRQMMNEEKKKGQNDTQE